MKRFSWRPMKANGWMAFLSRLIAPAKAYEESSAFRPALQVLPLALEVLWDPLNFYGLLQFLTHSVCPVPAYARYKLAGKLADKPGIGGKTWSRVLEKIEEHYVGAESEAAQTIRQKIRFWVEHDRYDQAVGANLDAVIERVEALTNYFRGRLADTDRAARIAFNSGFGHVGPPPTPSRRSRLRAQQQSVLVSCRHSSHKRRRMAATTRFTSLMSVQLCP